MGRINGFLGDIKPDSRWFPEFFFNLSYVPLSSTHRSLGDPNNVSDSIGMRGVYFGCSRKLIFQKVYLLIYAFSFRQVAS